MKRAVLILTALLSFASLQAQLNGNGYYRVQNAYTKRYACVIDSYGSIDIASTTADMTAIKTIKYFENVCSDPASVIYFEKTSVGYNLRCQGTDTYSIIGYYPRISDNGNGTYKTYAERAGMVAYLADEISSSVEGVMVSNSKKSRDWYILPFSQEDERWFGLAPDIAVGNSYVQSFFAEFPFTFASTGMKASIVTKIDNELGVVVYKDWEGEVPGATPVIVTCSSADATSNRLDIHSSSAKAPKENLMKGVYFRNPKKKATNPHHNVVNNDPATMRILGLTTDGQLGFIRCTDSYLPRNRAYISVSASAPAELKLVTEEEYANMQPAVIDEEAFTKEYGDGWYQLTNTVTGRTLALLTEGNTPASSLITLSADDATKSSNPGTVFRIAATQGGYSLRSQGVELSTLAGVPFRLWRDEATGAYLLFSTSGDKDTYIGSDADGNITDDKATALWKIESAKTGLQLAMPTGSDKPTWTSLYADFPCTLSEGAEAYIVTVLHADSIPAAILQPVNSRSIPAGCPVLVKSGDNVSLTIEATTTTPPANSLLKGNLLPAAAGQTYYSLEETAGTAQLRLHAAGALARNTVIVPAEGITLDVLPLMTQTEYEALVTQAHEQWLKDEAARKAAEEEARKKAEEEARRKAEEEARKEAARKAHESIVWFSQHEENGWYRLFKKDADEYLTLQAGTREGLSSQSYDPSNSNPAYLTDAGSIFRIDADTAGITSLRCQGTEVSALLGDTVYMRHQEDGSYAITGLDSTWTAACITGIDQQFKANMSSVVDNFSQFGVTRWAAVCFDFPYSVPADFSVYIVTATHTAVPAVEWKRINSELTTDDGRYNIPAGTPVLLNYSPDGSNRPWLIIKGNSAVAPAGNLLQGCLLAGSADGAYHAFTAEESSIVFLRTGEDSHPANSAWLPTAADLADRLPMMTKEEYEEAVKRLGIDNLPIGEAEQVFYTPSGIAVRSSLDALAPGVYIAAGRKIVIR